MEHAQTLDEVATLIRSVLDPDGKKGLQIDAATTADQTEGWDSFSHATIVVTIEEKFGIEFKTAEIELLRHVGELVTLIEKKNRAKSGK